MNITFNSDRLEELGESEYVELKSVYCKLQDVREAVDRMHDEYLQEGSPPAFDRVEALKLLVGDLYDDMERYFRPVCDTDSAFTPAMPEIH